MAESGFFSSCPASLPFAAGTTSMQWQNIMNDKDMQKVNQIKRLVKNSAWLKEWQPNKFFGNQ